jgi:hypothetical protein
MKRGLTSTALAAAALGSAAVAAPITPEARLERMLEGRTPGKPVNCINSRDIRSTQIIDRTAIVYRVGSKLYVNRPHNANTLRRDDIMVSRSFGSQLCRIDVVTTVDRTALFPTGFVNLGSFVPYTKN